MRPNPSTTNATYHRTTVLLEEAIPALAPWEGGCCLDGTFGGGGHNRALFEKLDTGRRLLRFSKDPQATQIGKVLAAEDSRFATVQHSSAELGDEIRTRGLEGRVDGILLDLGVSSPQFDDPGRDFSSLNDGPLDMRMNPDQGISTAKFIANATKEEIARVFKGYDEEYFVKQMTHAIVQRHQEQPFERAADPTEMIAVVDLAWEKGKNPATRAFQSLRIHVGNELGDSERGPNAALKLLTVGGHLVVTSFHFLEDRVVKLFMRKHTKDETDDLPHDLLIRFRIFEPRLRLLDRLQHTPEEELKANPRSRNTVMHVTERLR